MRCTFTPLLIKNFVVLERHHIKFLMLTNATKYTSKSQIHFLNLLKSVAIYKGTITNRTFTAFRRDEAKAIWYLCERKVPRTASDFIRHFIFEWSTQLFGQRQSTFCLFLCNYYKLLIIMVGVCCMLQERVEIYGISEFTK